MKITILERSPGVFRLRIETVNGASGERRFSYETVKGTADTAAFRRFEILQKAGQGSWSAPDKLVVGDFLDKWLADKHALGLVARTTKDQYEMLIRVYVKPAFGATRVQHLAGHQIQDLYTKLLTKDGLGAGTVLAVHRNILTPALKHARKVNLIMVNPMDEVTPPKATTPKPKAIDAAGIERLLAVLSGGHRYEAIALTALGTGMRRGELCGLRWKDVDLAGRAIHVRGQLVQHVDNTKAWKAPKTDAGIRTVSIPPQVVELLAALRAAGAERGLASVSGDAYVFVSSHGDPFSPEDLTTMFSKLCTKAGLDGHSFHSLRHTHVTMLLKAVGKEGAKAVAQRVGHSNVNVTLSVYQTVFEGEDRGLGDLAAGLFGSQKRR